MLRLRWFAAAVFFSDWLLTAFTWLTWNRHPSMGQDPFLVFALAARDDGMLTLGNDHPLYPLILSLWASRTSAAFTLSKLFSLGVGAAALAAAAGLGTALFGLDAALLAAVLLSVNWVFLSLSMSLRAEVLLPLLFFVSWACAWRGFREDGRWFLAAGAAAGLAALTKGTGTLLALAWAAAFLLAAWRDRTLWRRAPWYLAGFLGTAGFLWWANHAVLGDATYNYSTRHALWLDSWWDAAGTPLADQSFAGFLARHGWLGIPRRLFSGMWTFAPVWLATLSPSPSFPIFLYARWPLAAAAAWSLWRARRTAWEALRRFDGAALYTAFLPAGFFALFSWYHQVSPSERFVAPLSPMLYLLAAAAFVPELRRFGAWARRRQPAVNAAAAGVGLLAAFTAVGLAIKVAVWGVANPFVADRPEPCYADAMAWTASRQGKVLYGPSVDLSVYSLPRSGVAVGAPEGGPPPDLGAWLRERGIRSAVADWDMARIGFFEGTLESLPEGGVKVLKLPKGWREAGRDRLHEPPHLVLLEELP
ncbi:MAG: glycosyltransferase family 39 protein [Elusimicrobia bacterium]|nr:glycosyltransferase family 39 protein [Elusimicrobiota bacterium]